MDERPNKYDVPGAKVCERANRIYVQPRLVAAKQQICKGDIVTVKDEQLVRVSSISDTRDGRDWGDVSNGAFMALESVDTMNGSREIEVYEPGACVETILDEGIAEGSPVFVDLRACRVNKERTSRSRAVDSTTPKGEDLTLWQRSRGLPPEVIDNDIEKRAFLGTLQCIRTRFSSERPLSKLWDLGIVLLGR